MIAKRESKKFDTSGNVAHTDCAHRCSQMLAVARVIDVPSRVDKEPLSAIRLARVGEVTRDNGSELPGRTRPFLDWKAQELLVTDEDTAAFCVSPCPSTYCSNERMLENLIDIGLDVAARSPVIDGPCGCHPP
jgi:hypothetical protein